MKIVMNHWTSVLNEMTACGDLGEQVRWRSDSFMWIS